MTCELCGAAGVELSTGLVICSDCFYGRRGHNRMTAAFLNRRFAAKHGGQGDRGRW